MFALNIITILTLSLLQVISAAPAPAVKAAAMPACVLGRSCGGCALQQYEQCDPTTNVVVCAPGTVSIGAISSTGLQTCVPCSDPRLGKKSHGKCP